MKTMAIEIKTIEAQGRPIYQCYHDGKLIESFMTSAESERWKLIETRNQNLTDLYNLSPSPEEPFFSKFPCHACGSSLAGNRYTCVATVGKKHNDEKVYLECCVDCFGYFFT